MARKKLRKKRRRFRGLPDQHLKSARTLVRVVRSESKDVSRLLKKRDCKSAIGALANLQRTQGAYEQELLWAGVRNRRNTGLTTYKLTKRVQSMCAIPPHLSKHFSK